VHVLLTSDHLPPHRSGHALAVAWWIAALTDAGVRLTVVGDAPPPPGQPASVRWIRPPRLPGLPFGHPLASVRGLGNALASLQGDPAAVIHAHGYGPLPQQVWRALPEVPLVLSVHQFPAGSGAPGIPGLQHLMRRMLARAVARAARISVPSRHSAALLQAGWGREAEVVPSGVEARFEAPVVGREATSEPLRFLFIGRRTRDKNFPQFVRLAQAHPEHRWTAIGHGPIDPSPAVAARASGDASAVIAALADADALLTPGLHETQGLAVLEALHRGVAVAAPSGTAQAEMVADGINGALYPPDHDRAALAALVRAARLTRSGRVTLPAGYQRSEIAAAMLQLLTDASRARR